MKIWSLIAIQALALGGILLHACDSPSAQPSPSPAPEGESSQPQPARADCKTACSRLIDLAMEDIEASLRQMPKQFADKMRPGLIAKVKQSQASDTATCTSKCEAGRLDTSCVVQAKTYMGAATCLKGTGRGAPNAKARARVDEVELQRRSGTWRGGKLTRRSGRVGSVAFTIEIPEGLRATQVESDYVRYEDSSNPWGSPGFHIVLENLSFPSTNEAALEIVDPPGTPVIMRNEKVGNTHVVVYKNSRGSYVKSHVLLAAGGKVLNCWGTQASANRSLNLEEAGQRFAEVCGTISTR